MKNTLSDLNNYLFESIERLTDDELSDEELDSIGHAFQGESFEKISTTEIVQKLVKISPKALLKLGKFI